MYINEEGLLNHADYFASPYCDDRPDKDDISLIVLHNISLPPNIFGDTYVKALFLGKLSERKHEHSYLQQITDLKVSAHFFILRDGSIQQYVPTIARAWHAGVSNYQGRERCNDFSVGIELNGSDQMPYTLRQYKALAQLCYALMSYHQKITPERITTHSHIAPERKTDPGPAFHYHFFRRLLALQSNDKCVT